MVRLPRNEKQTYCLNSRLQMWPSDLTLVKTLTFNFQCQIWNFDFSQPKVVRLPRNDKQTYRLNSRPQMWPMVLTLALNLTFEFSRSNVTWTICWPRSGVRIYPQIASDRGDFRCRRAVDSSSSVHNSLKIWIPNLAKTYQITKGACLSYSFFIIFFLLWPLIYIPYISAGL